MNLRLSNGLLMSDEYPKEETDREALCKGRRPGGKVISRPAMQAPVGAVGA